MRKLDRWTTAGAAVLIVGALLACKKKEEEPEPVASATAAPEPVKEEPKEAEAPKDELKRYGDKEINESGTVKVTVFNTKVYKEADESTSFVATLSPGTLVNRKARYGNTWMLVDYPSGVGELSPGWVLAKNLSSYIEKVKPEEVAKQDAAAPAATTTPDEGEQAPIPAICSYEGELTEAVFDELWKIAIRWEVGDNRRIVPEARKRLAAFGPAVLPHVDRVFGQSASGLEIRGFVGVLRPLVDDGHEEAVAEVLRTNVASEDSTRSTSALLTLADLKLTSLAPDVAKLLESGDRRRARRAAATPRSSHRPRPRAQTAAVTTTSILQPGRASAACTVARGGALPGATQASQTSFIAAKSAMSAR